MANLLGIKIHELKIEPEYFEAQLMGLKNFEIRENDRDYHVGDWIRLRKWNGLEKYGQPLDVAITFVTDYKQQEGYVVLGTRKLK